MKNLLKALLSVAVIAIGVMPALAFPDVSKDYWAASQINLLSEQGVIVGYPDGTFKPDANVTRAEFAAMAIRALGQQHTKIAQPITYADVDERNSNIAGKAIGGALVGGAIAGPGIGAVKFGAKKIKNKLSGITKKSEMQVPTDEETGKETKEDRDEVLESPNEQEKRRMNNSITKEDELKEYYKNKILDKAEQIRKGE